MNDGDHARWTREFFDNDAVAFGHVDAELRIRAVNRAMSALDGVAPEACVGRPLRDLLPPALAERVERWLVHVRDTGEPVVDLRLDDDPGADGTPRVYLASYYPIESADGRGVGSAVIPLDRPTLAALDRGTPRFRALAASLPEPVFSCAPDGRIDFANARWFAATGTRLGDPWVSALHHDDRATAAAAWRTAREQDGPLQVECRLRLAGPDGAAGPGGEVGHDWFLLRGLRRVNVGTDSSGAWVVIASRIGSQKAREQRLRALVDIARSTAMATAPDGAVDALADALVPSFADFVVCLLGRPGAAAADDAEHAPTIELRVARDWSAERETVLRDCIARLPSLLPTGHPAADAAAFGEPVLVSDADQVIERGTIDAAHVEARRRIGAHSVIFVPLRVEDRLIGMLNLGRTGPPGEQDTSTSAKPRFGPHDLEFAREVGLQAAATIDRLQRYRAAQAMLARMHAEIRTRDRIAADLARELRTPVAPLHEAARRLRDGQATPADAARLGDSIDDHAHHLARSADALARAARAARPTDAERLDDPSPSEQPVAGDGG